MIKQAIKVYHEFGPYYNKDSKILILGSIPSPKSREVGFYYGHPQNRFWLVMSQVFNDVKPITIEDKKDFLKRHNIALWDVLASCDIKGASDSSIKNPIVNDLNCILNNSMIERIITVGKTAHSLYNKYIFPTIKRKAICLPSTSSANCRISVSDLIESYSIIKY